MADRKSVGESASAPQACLDIMRSATRLEFICTSPLKRLFSLDARMGGNVAVSRGPSEGGRPTSNIEVPLRVGSEKLTVRLTHGRDEVEQKGTVLEAVAQVEADGTQLVRFVIGDEKDRAWYRFTLPPGLALLDFQPIERARVMARSAPSVSQLSSLLRSGLAVETAARDVFAALCEESPFPEAAEILAAWQGDGPALWGHDAIAALAERSGIHASMTNLEGAAVYAEAQCGAIPPEDFARLCAGDQIHALSLYTVQTLAAALRLPFLPLSLPEGDGATWRALVELSPAGVVQRTADGGWRLVMHGNGRDTPSGDLLLVAPVISRLEERDLRLFLEAERTAYACYQSDLDRRRVWLRVQGDAPLTFVEHFRTFRFQGSVLGELKDAGATGDLPRVFKDHRGSLHYFSSTETPEMEDAGQAVYLLAPPDLPERLAEVSPDRNIPNAPPNSDVRRLERMGRALADVIWAYSEVSASGLPEVVALVEGPSLHSTLEKTVDGSTIDHLSKTWLIDDAMLEICPLASLHGVLDDELMLEFAALSLVQSLCASDLTSSRGFRKGYKALPLRALLRDHLLHVLDHRSGRIKAAACRLLATRGCIGSPNEQSLVEYELQRRLDDPEHEVADASAVALARLAMSSEVEPPSVWRVRVPEFMRAEAEAQSTQKKAIAAVTAEWMALRRRLAATLGGVLDDAAGAPPQALSAWLHEVRRAMAAAPLTQGRVVLGGPELAEVVGPRVLRMIRTYASETGLSMSDVIADGVAPWMRFVAQREAADIHGGPDADEEHLGLDVFRTSIVCSPTALWIEQGDRISPFAMALLRRAAAGGLAAARLARLPLSSRSVLRLPAALHLQIYDPSSGSFDNLLQTQLATGLLAASPEEAEMLALIVAAIPRPAVLATAASTEIAPLATLQAPAASSAPIDAEAAPEAHRARAKRLLGTFGLAAGLEQAVLYVLRDAGAHDAIEREVDAQQLMRKVAVSSK